MSKTFYVGFLGAVAFAALLFLPTTASAQIWIDGTDHGWLYNNYDPVGTATVNGGTVNNGGRINNMTYVTVGVTWKRLTSLIFCIYCISTKVTAPALRVAAYLPMAGALPTGL